MATTGITAKQIADAANKMHNENVTVSARRLREVLGGGSMTTILKYLQAWRSEQQARTDTPPEMPDAVREAALNALHDVWRTANHHARQTIDEIRTVAGKRGADLEHDLDEALSAAEELEEQLAERTAEAAAGDERITALERESAARDAEIRVLRERLEAAGEQLTQVTIERISEVMNTPPPRRRQAQIDSTPTIEHFNTWPTAVGQGHR